MSSAKQFVTDGLTACLPPGTPLMGEIILAKFTGKEKAEGELILFDGGQGTVELSKYAPVEGAWSQRWLSLDGGDINWTGTAWERVPQEHVQLDLFAGLAALANPAEGKEVSP